MCANRREGKRVLAIIVGNYAVTGVVTYLEERLPRLVEQCHSRVVLYVPGKIVEKGRAAALENAGICIVEGGIDLANPIARRIGLQKQLRMLFKKGSFDVVHVNTASRLVNLIALSEAKKAGVQVRIAHSHSVNTKLGRLAHAVEPYYRIRISKLATDLLACSDEAGVFLCGQRSWREKGKIAPNGIDVDKYAYSESVRLTVREEMGVDSDTLIVGFVGRLANEKNPLFLMRVFAAIAAKHKNCVLWVIGDGNLRASAEELAKNLGVSNRALFFGARDDVPDLLQAIDVLVLPSEYEGFLLVLVEGEASGIPSFVSDSIPRASLAVGCPVSYLSLSETAESWANYILNSDLSRNLNGAALVKEAGLSIEAGVKVLSAYY